MTATWWQDLPGSELLAEVDEARMGDELVRAMNAPRPRQARTLREWYAEWIAWHAAEQKLAAVTGIPGLDAGLGSMIRPTEVVTLAAPTNTGKTWIMQTFVEANVTTNALHHALVCSLEMSGEQMAERFAVRALGATPAQVQLAAAAGELDADAVMNAWVEAERVRVCDQPLTVDQISDLIDQQRADGFDPSIVAVDYFGLLSFRGQGSRYDRASANALAIKELAKEHRIILLVCAQVSRGPRDTGEPTINQIRDSGVIEESSDRVLLAWPDDQTINVRVGKNRHGPRGMRVECHLDLSMRLVGGKGEESVRSEVSQQVDNEFEGIF